MLARGNASIKRLYNSDLPGIYRIHEVHGRPDWVIIAFRIPFTRRSITIMACAPTMDES
jgi:hypothetical protein